MRFGRARLSALHRGFPRAALRLHAIRSRPCVTRAGGPGVVQPDGRIRYWGRISVLGEARPRYLRVVTLEDGETVHNAFFDRNFREGVR